MLLQKTILSLTLLASAQAISWPQLRRRLATGIVADGNPGEWTDGDIFTKMYLAGDKTKRSMATLYWRGDCSTVCVYVKGEADVIIDPNGDTWIKDYQDNKNAGDKLVLQGSIAYIKNSNGDVNGWEACFSAPKGRTSTTALEVHNNWGTVAGKLTDTGSTGKKNMQGFISADYCRDTRSKNVPTPTPAPTQPKPKPTAAPTAAPTQPKPKPTAAPTTPKSNPNPPTASPTTEENARGRGNGRGNGKPTSAPTTPDENGKGKGNGRGKGKGNGEGGSYGDPHVKTWTGSVFDFHGACDLVLVHAPQFNNGQGLDLHVRTTMRDDWSYISEMVLRIGDDIFQVGGNAEYFLNGEASAAVPFTVGGFHVKVVHKTEKTHRFDVKLRDYGKIVIKVYNEFLGVNFHSATEDAFGESTGIMGTFAEGTLLSREGDVMQDTNAYGMNWQVRPDVDPILFREAKGPQYPQQCDMPVVKPLGQRRLAESMVSFEVAAEACAGWHEEAKEACIYDVMATGDLAMADAGAF